VLVGGRTLSRTLGVGRGIFLDHAVLGVELGSKGRLEDVKKRLGLVLRERDGVVDSREEALEGAPPRYGLEHGGGRPTQSGRVWEPEYPYTWPQSMSW